MIRRVVLVVLVVGAFFLAGCGDSDRGKYREQKDRPRSGDKVDKAEK